MIRAAHRSIQHRRPIDMRRSGFAQLQEITEPLEELDDDEDVEVEVELLEVELLVEVELLEVELLVEVEVVDEVPLLA
jgi:hypothetical protein